jgi:diguanylate cyclase (GGDEF)-like protein/PAS domain S-box-containing protein
LINNLKIGGQDTLAKRDAMANEAEFYKNLIDNMHDGVYFVDRDRQITYWNRGAERITGYEGKMVMGHHCSDNLLNHVTAEGKMLCKDGCPLAACMLDGKEKNAEVFLHHAEGHRLPVHVSAAPIRDEKGEIIGAVETFFQRTRADVDLMELNNLRNKVNMDELTGLRNRVYAEKHLQGLLIESQQEVPSAAVLFIDVDNFKGVNDTYGHEIGDQVLKMVASTLRNNLREGDIAARWGGDEFMAILNDVTNDKALKKIAEKLRMLVALSRLDIPGSSISATISVGGIMMQPREDREALMERVDKLMYRAKMAGRNQTVT